MTEYGQLLACLKIVILETANISGEFVGCQSTPDSFDSVRQR